MQNMNRRAHRNEKGFSLLEIMIVLFIIGLTGILVPILFTGALSNISLNTATKEVASAIRLAQTQSIARKETYIVNINQEKNEYWLSSEKKSSTIFNAEKNFLSEKEDSDNQEEEVTVSSNDAFLNKKKSIPKEIKINSGSEEEKYKIYLYPNGSSSGGDLIFTSDESEKKFELLINQINGKTIVKEVVND
ncbi:MAG: prepilin-type N-terminal cleavage/methylation domain-containing protein [Nitrospinae bacterium]|nr:prepilin-type N-terminal cleavage/methylation domain-containing protein [Nitrospinota bacterium]